LKLILALLLSLVSSLASADAPLFDSSPPRWRHEDSALSDRLKVYPGVKKVIPLKLNRYALQGNVITVSVNNKTYRFVGRPKWHEVTKGTSWSGTVEGSLVDRLSISVNDGPEGGVYGSLDVDGLHFTIHGMKHAPIVFVVERGPNLELRIPDGPDVLERPVPAAPNKGASRP